jgi:hypothetical protein
VRQDGGRTVEVTFNKEQIVAKCRIGRFEELLVITSRAKHRDFHARTVPAAPPEGKRGPARDAKRC